MVMGTVLMIGALSLLLYNNRESTIAAQASNELLAQVVQQIEDNTANTDATKPLEGDSTILGFIGGDAQKMTEVEIDGYTYIGFVSIPTLSLELPVMSGWDYDLLEISPCRFTGSTKSDDLVVMAHNYSSHFGGLKDLVVGDTVTFVDMDGVTIEYEVVAMDVLSPNAKEEMTAGEYDLVLFTCTYGGKSRVTVCCDRVK